MVTHDVALAQPTEADIPDGSAIRIASGLLMQQPNVIEPTGTPDVYNYPIIEAAGYAFKPEANFITLTVDGERQAAWVVKFCLDGVPATIGIVTVLSPSGEVVEATWGHLAEIKRIWEAEKGAQVLWSLEDDYLFELLYEPRTSVFVHTLPQHNDALTQDEAKQHAASAVAKAYGVAEDKLLDNYLINADLVVADAQNPASRAWLITFLEQDAQTGEYFICFDALISSADGTVLRTYEYEGGHG